MSDTPLVWVDLETGGLDAKKHPVIQFVVKDVVWRALCRPQISDSRSALPGLAHRRIHRPTLGPAGVENRYFGFDSRLGPVCLDRGDLGSGFSPILAAPAVRLFVAQTGRRRYCSQYGHGYGSDEVGQPGAARLDICCSDNLSGVVQRLEAHKGWTSVGKGGRLIE